MTSRSVCLFLLVAGVVGLAARGETPTAFGRRCIPADCVAPPSNIPDILGRRALSAGRLAALGATPEFNHGLPAAAGGPQADGRAARPSASESKSTPAWRQAAYVKASNPRAGAQFGYAVALSSDGNTLAVG